MLVEKTRKEIEIIKKNNPDARIRELGKGHQQGRYRYKIRGFQNIPEKEEKTMAEEKANSEEKVTPEKSEGKLTGVFNDMIMAIISSKVQEIESKKTEIIALKKSFDVQVEQQKEEQKKEYLKYTQSAQGLISSTLTTIKSLEGQIKNVKETQVKEYTDCKDKLTACNTKLQKIIQHFKTTPG